MSINLPILSSQLLPHFTSKLHSPAYQPTSPTQHQPPRMHFSTPFLALLLSTPSILAAPAATETHQLVTDFPPEAPLSAEGLARLAAKDKSPIVTVETRDIDVKENRELVTLYICKDKDFTGLHGPVSEFEFQQRSCGE
ncbi:hypothetical protein B0J14DRAFT_696396 [Halenospora varia]|nr:hypothetical protein B0J14DRAFT_696396 [Halenospora varia]